MKFILLLTTLIVSTVSLAAGTYSDDNFVICDVDLKRWPSVKEQGFLEIAEDAQDNFIHCARPSQLHYVMNKYFKGTTQVILVTHASKVTSILEYENNYPHLYGKLYLKDVIYSVTKAPDANGHYSLPEEFAKDEIKLNCELVRNDSSVGNVRWNCFED